MSGVKAKTPGEVEAALRIVSDERHDDGDVQGFLLRPFDGSPAVILVNRPRPFRDPHDVPNPSGPRMPGA